MWLTLHTHWFRLKPRDNYGAHLPGSFTGLRIVRWKGVVTLLNLVIKNTGFRYIWLVLLSQWSLQVRVNRTKRLVFGQEMKFIPQWKSEWNINGPFKYFHFPATFILFVLLASDGVYFKILESVLKWSSQTSNLQKRGFTKRAFIPFFILSKQGIISVYGNGRKWIRRSKLILVYTHSVILVI